MCFWWIVCNRQKRKTEENTLNCHQWIVNGQVVVGHREIVRFNDGSIDEMWISILDSYRKEILWKIMQLIIDELMTVMSTKLMFWSETKLVICDLNVKLWSLLSSSCRGTWKQPILKRQRKSTNQKQIASSDNNNNKSVKEKYQPQVMWPRFVCLSNSIVDRKARNQTHNDFGECKQIDFERWNYNNKTENSGEKNCRQAEQHAHSDSRPVASETARGHRQRLRFLRFVRLSPKC